MSTLRCTLMNIGYTGTPILFWMSVRQTRNYKYRPKYVWKEKSRIEYDDEDSCDEGFKSATLVATKTVVSASGSERAPYPKPGPATVVDLTCTSSESCETTESM